MTTSSRRFMATALAVAFLLAAAQPSDAAFPTPVLKCRAVIAKSGAKMTKSALKTLAGCHRRRAADGSLAGTDCNDLAMADFDGHLGLLETRFTNAVARRCAGVSPADALFASCPSPCSSAVPSIEGFDDVAACLVCLDEAKVEAFGRAAFRTPSSPILDAVQAKCLASLISTSQRLMNVIVGEGTRCQTAIEKSGATTTDECLGSAAAAGQSSAFAEAIDSAGFGPCAGLTLPVVGLQPCSDAGSPTDLAVCVQTEARSAADSLTAAYLELPADGSTGTTTTTLPPSASACPGRADTVLFARDSHVACSTNDDCAAPRTCDTTLGFCRTGTTMDIGWTGLAHRSDTDDGVLLPLRLSCEGPAPVCGKCNVDGIDPSATTCTCSNDSGASCSTPGSLTGECPACQGGTLAGKACGEDLDCSAGLCARRCTGDNSTICASDSDCPGSTCRRDGLRCENGGACSSTADCVGTCSATAACDCLLGPPMPIAAGGTPMCVVQRLTGPVTGTVNVDTGANELDLPITSKVFLGLAVAAPCPVCGGKCSDNPTHACRGDADCDIPATCVQDIAGDGNRDGLCIDGASAGSACEVSATNASLPAVPFAEGGAGYSQDCQPGVGMNISGVGLRVPRHATTGSSSLSASLSCGGNSPELNCPCLTCSSDRQVACHSDAECAGQDGRCSGASSIACTSDAPCVSASVGPCRQFASVLRCDKVRSRVCATNVDCENVNVGSCSPSTCSSAGIGEFPEPNQCESGACSDLGGGNGQCTSGPDDRYCDGVLKADGSGIFACAEDADCGIGSIGIAGGNCNHVERRRCFPGSVTAEGRADPLHPVTATTFCMPPTANAGINVVQGLPGPVREVAQQQVTLRCADSPSSIYVPGVGGCP